MCLLTLESRSRRLGHDMQDKRGESDRAGKKPCSWLSLATGVRKARRGAASLLSQCSGREDFQVISNFIPYCPEKRQAVLFCAVQCCRVFKALVNAV